MDTCLTDMEQPGRVRRKFGERLKVLHFDEVIFERLTIYPHGDV